MKALILAGSDTGRRENLAMALREIRKRFPVAAVSHPVRSRPWSGEGDDYLNAALIIETELMPEMHSLNTEADYVFSVESFDSGLDYYREKTEEVNGMGAEVEINKRGNGNFGYGGNELSKRVMLKEGVDEYVFEGIDPGHWVINHTFGPVLWDGELTAADLIGEGEPGIEAKLTELGHGTTVTGELRMKVVRGPETGKVVINVIRY